jgi:hypothetical protein
VPASRSASFSGERPEEAREVRRGEVASDGSQPVVREGTPARRRNGKPGAQNR